MQQIPNISIIFLHCDPPLRVTVLWVWSFITQYTVKTHTTSRAVMATKESLSFYQVLGTFFFFHWHIPTLSQEEKHIKPINTSHYTLSKSDSTAVFCCSQPSRDFHCPVTTSSLIGESSLSTDWLVLSRSKVSGHGSVPEKTGYTKMVAVIACCA